MSNANSNENSSSKIEEVPEGRRSMMVQNRLIINAVNDIKVFILPPARSILEGEQRLLLHYDTPSAAPFITF